MLAWITAVLGVIAVFLGSILTFLKIIKALDDEVKDSLKELVSQCRARLSAVKDLLSKPAVRLSIIAIIVLIILYLGLCSSCRRDDPPRVAIKTAHDRYVSAMGADRDWLLMAQAFVIDDYEEFTLLCQDDGQVAFQTWHKKDGKNRFITAMGGDWDWMLRAETSEIDNYERFTLLDADSGKQRPCSKVVKSLEDAGEVIIALQTYHNRLVTAMNDDWDWKLRAEATELGDSEKFRMILLPDDNSGLCSICP